MLKRVTVFLYGVISYLVFLGTFLYAAGFVGNLLVPKSIDSGRDGSFGMALAINAGLLGLFAVQHSVMARGWFKRAWTKIVPEPAERSTYVLFSSLALILLFRFWQPMGVTIWEVQNPLGQAIIHAFYFFGLMLVLVSTFLIDHFDLFGLRQVWLYLRGIGYTPLPLRTPWLYKQVRHPLYLGWFFFFWSTPTMTVAHLVMAVATTAYILLAIQFEERDLIRMHGPAYQRYRETVPMIFPTGRKDARAAGSEIIGATERELPVERAG